MKRHIERGLHCENYDTDEKFITILDSMYPESLKDLSDPPYVLFYRGNINFLNQSMIAVVGSRNPSFYAIEATQKIVMKIKNRYVIVSGLAKGIDACAHHAALDCATVAVLGNGIDITYPTQNNSLQETLSKHHLILSEYPKGTRPKRSHFPTRNRIIAGLACKVLVMSAKLRSGTMSTVNHTINLNREVIVLPHALNDKTGEGCNQLIQEGASLLTNLTDLSNI